MTPSDQADDSRAATPAATTPAAMTPADVAAQLKQRIFTGRFKPGQRLIEIDLAEEFDVGRSKIREAFRILAGEGLLQIVANRGALVRRHSRAELLEMGRAREVLEGLAARIAAEKTLTPGQEAALHAHQAELDAAEAAEDVPRYDLANQAYHRLIEQIADNPYVTDLIEKVRVPLLGLPMPHAYNAGTIVRSNQDHRFITYAILAGVPEMAEAAMRAHVRAGNAKTATLPEDLFR